MEECIANFNSETGKKLYKVCPNCWVKKRAYNCGYDTCPGLRLHILELTQGK